MWPPNDPTRYYTLQGHHCCIPNMFPTSGAPTAPPNIRFSDFSSFSHSPRELTDIPAWVAEIGPNHGFSRILKNFPKILIYIEK